MKCIAFAASAALLLATSAAAQDDPATIKAKADAQNAQLATLKAQLDLESSLKASAPNNASSIATGEKGIEAQVLKYLTYRAAAAKLVSAIGANWKDAKSDDKVTPIVIVGTAPPSFALLNTYRSDKATAAAALQSALDGWNIAKNVPSEPPAPPAAGVHIETVPFAALPAIGMLLNVASMLSPSSSVAGAPLSADNAQIAALVEQAIAKAGGSEDFVQFELARNGEKAATDLLIDLTPGYTKVRGIYEHEYAVAAATKYKNDDKNAAVKAAGTTLSAALAAYDGLHAKLLADSGGVETSVAIQRLQTLEGSQYSKKPLLYILGNEASVSVETMKGPAHWFDSHPFKLRSMVTLNYLYIAGSDPTPTGSRGVISCVIIGPKFTDIPSIGVDAAVDANTCGHEVALAKPAN